MIKSPLRYPGGKSRAVDLISTLVPEFDEFREPFLGGGSIFIYLKQRFPKKKFWVNDIYFNLFKFWEMCKKDVNAVIDKVYEWRNQFTNGKELHKFLTDNISNFNDLEKASAFFIFNRITFSGTSESGGYSEQAFHGRFTESSIHRLKKFGEVINGTKITNCDFQKVIEKDGDNVFLFLDPPYHSATKSALYGKNGNLHKGFDHIRFAETMKNCNHKWLITYDDSDYIRQLFSFANIIPWDLTYGMRNQTDTSDQTGKELFISNFLTKLPRQLAQERQFTLFEPKVKYKRTKKHWA
ncbi:MAG: DNA adenine methylase [Bacteroidota bacterium]